MLEFSIGLSALQAAQQAMQVTGNNIANANTPGYHLQAVKLAAQSPMQLNGQSYGRGVSVVNVQREVNQQLESAITTQTTQSGYVDSLTTALSQLQSAIPTDASSIPSLLGAVFNGLQQASSQLNNSASSTGVIASATTLAQQFNSLASGMIQMGNSLDSSIGASVTSINTSLQQIASLNAQIANLVNNGGTPNDLLDARDHLVNTVAQQMPLQIQQGSQQQVTLLSAGTPLVIGGTATKLQSGLDKSGAMTVSVANGTASTPLTIDSGELGGMLDARNTELPDYQQRLDTLAQKVSAAFDAIQTTGVGTAGGFTTLTGQRGVLNTSAPLNAAGLAFPPQAGSLYVGMTNTATGQRTMAQVPIDPATQSIQDVANSIGAANPNLQAFVNNQTGTLSLFAAPGYTFDFTGGVAATPTTSFSAGTTVTATTGGTPVGGTNDNYKFTFLSSGTVGVTPGLQAQVTDQSGNILGTVNVGRGYSAGQSVTAANGVTLSLGAGNVTAGDSLSTQVIGASDTAGILTALGLNTFFSGNNAATMQVNSQLTTNPNMLATSQTGQPGDTSNLQRFAALQDIPIMAGGTQTMADYFNQMVSDVGTKVSTLNQQGSTNQLLMTRLHAQQQSTSGVDINQEMMRVINYQQMFQSASQYISAVNTMYQKLFQSL